MLIYSTDPIELTLLVDDQQEESRFREAVSTWDVGSVHSIAVLRADEVKDRAHDDWQGLKHVQNFQHGHPCWRKITDPLALSGGEQAIIIDPDVLFIRPYSFPRPNRDGIFLMWQPRNCLYPLEAVSAVFSAGYSLADFVDIGIAEIQWRPDWSWLDQLLSFIDMEKFRPYMHVEPIVWSAMAMQFGGGYLDPKVWTCFYNSFYQRFFTALRFRVGFKIDHMDLSRTLALHLGGPIKNQLELIRMQLDNSMGSPTNSANADTLQADDRTPLPLREYTRAQLARKVYAVKLLQTCGLKAG